jgi:hypothetical protein
MVSTVSHSVFSGVHRVDGDERALAEALGIDDLAIDVGKNLEDAANAKVVAVARDAVADLALALGVVFEGFDPDQFADLRIAKHAHAAPVRSKVLSASPFRAPAAPGIRFRQIAAPKRDGMPD